MRRTTPLTAAALMGLALLSPTTAATAAGETCRGEAATIVGAPRTDIVGTEGRDVVVTNQSQDVTTFGGDDLVCITGPDLARGASRPVEVDTGPGNDVVDGTAADHWPADALLGAGADRFDGGAGDDYVRSGTLSANFREHLDTEVDVVMGGGGRDLLTTGQTGLVGSDVLTGGDGDDSLTYLGAMTPASLLDGGPGRDSTPLGLAVGENTVDSAAGELRHGPAVVSRWTSVETFWLRDPEAGTASVTIAGSPADEQFSVSGAGRLVADLGDGNDGLTVPRALSADSRVVGGGGRDHLALGTDTHEIAWDLAGDRLFVGDAWTVPVAGFEGAFVAAPAVALWGTDGPNSLSTNSCDVRLNGRDGSDHLYLSGDHVFETFRDCADRTVMLGGRGHDVFRSRSGSEDRMVGGRGNDRFDSRGGDDTVFGGPGRDVATLGNGRDAFLGGPGRDRVDGEQGRDRCRAERERRCER